MTDTPRHIKELQLKIWLSKTPMERLYQFIIDNEALYSFWKTDKAKNITDTANNIEKTLIR